MAKKRKKPVPLPRVITEHRQLTPEEWGKICSIRWYGESRLIGALFGGNGGIAYVLAAECVGRWREIALANRHFFNHGLPYRITDYELPDADERERKSGFSISRFGLRLETITKTL